jgi:hypothetical protein
MIGHGVSVVFSPMSPALCQYTCFDQVSVSVPQGHYITWRILNDTVKG